MKKESLRVSGYAEVNGSRTSTRCVKLGVESHLVKGFEVRDRSLVSKL